MSEHTTWLDAVQAATHHEALQWALKQIKEAGQ